MLRRLPLEARAQVRTLHADPAPRPARSAPGYQADAARLHALLVAELSRDFVALAEAATARAGEAEALALRAHPDDLALLDARAHALDPQLARVADPSLTRGGCVVQSAAGELDATVETRASLLLAAAEVHA